MPFYVRAHLGPIGWSHRIGGRSRHPQRKPASQRHAKVVATPPRSAPTPQVAEPAPDRRASWTVTATKQGEEPIKTEGLQVAEALDLAHSLWKAGWTVSNELVHP